MRFHQRVRPAHPRSVLVGWGALSPQIPGPPSTCSLCRRSRNRERKRGPKTGPRARDGWRVHACLPTSRPATTASGLARVRSAECSQSRSGSRCVCSRVWHMRHAHAQAHLNLEPRLRRVQRQAHSRRCAVVSTKQSMAAQAGAARIGRRRIGWSIHILSTRS